MRPAPRLAAVMAACGVLLAACGGGGTTTTDTAGAPPPGSDWLWQLPPNFPVPRVPADNPMTHAKVELGRHLFHDTRLSGNGTQSCASCHDPGKAFTDGLAQSVGSTGELHPRSAQGLANVAYNATLTWANPGMVTLERQMETPLFGTRPVEMGITDADKPLILGRLKADAASAARFAAAFPGEAEPVSWPHIIQAIASFERTLISGDSAYDRYLQGRATLTPAEQRGMNLFFGEKAECFHCHGGFNFNDQVVHAASRVVDTPFHNTGLYNLGGTGAYPEPNRGLFELTARAQDMGRFRAPSLRNVGVTAPYMHDGSIATLEEVLRTYAAGGRVIASGPHAGDGRANPFKEPRITLIDLSPEEQADIVAFLHTLTDHAFLTQADFTRP